MSDEGSYEYEYDENASDEDMEDNFEYTDEEEEVDDSEVALENAYYNAKGLRDSDTKEAVEAFEQVITQEKADSGNHGNGQWAYKAMKQLVKLHLRVLIGSCSTKRSMDDLQPGNGMSNSASQSAEEMMRQYNRLLQYIAEGSVSQNAIEKGINGMLERVSSLYQGTHSHNYKQQQGTEPDSTNNVTDPQVVARNVYDATLKIFQPKTGNSPNERLWFKTNLKYGQLLYEMNETNKLQLVLRDLKQAQTQNDAEVAAANSSGHPSSNSAASVSTSSSSTHLMEIYALQIQLYSRQKDNKKLREVFTRAMAVRGGIPHPRTLALIQELGGKMHMSSREYEAAGKTFFQAFKSYDEAGDPSRLRCLKYLVMASMLHASTINPFDSQEARPYRDDPEIVAMTNLVHAFHNNEIQTFESILKKHQGRIMGDDDFVREHVEDLLCTIRTQVLRRVIRPYTRISLQAIAKELNDIPVVDVESLLVSLILDGTLVGGQIDQVTGVLLKRAEKKSDSDHATGGIGSGNNNSSNISHPGGSIDSNTGVGGGRGGFKSVEEQKVDAMEELAIALENLSTHITSSRIKEQHHMRSMVR